MIIGCPRGAILCEINTGKFFAYDLKYPVEISTATGVINHADSEYASFFSRKLIFQNPSTVIWIRNRHLKKISIEVMRDNIRLTLET